MDYFHLVFSNLSFRLQEIRISFGVLIEIFRSFMQRMGCKFKFLSSSFSFPTLSSKIRRKKPFSSYLLAWEKCPKVLYTQISRSLLFISHWLVVSNGNILCISIAKSHHGLSVLSFSTGNRVISIFKSNYIRDPIPKTPEPTHKTP